MITEITIRVEHTDKPLNPYEVANLFMDLGTGVGYGADSLSEWSKDRITSCFVAKLTTPAPNPSHLDMECVKLIKTTTESTGQQALAAWSALQPFIGHLMREAVGKVRT